MTDAETFRRREDDIHALVLVALLGRDHEVTLLGAGWDRLGLPAPSAGPTHLADLMGRGELAEAVAALKRLDVEATVTFDAPLDTPGAGRLRFWATLDASTGAIRLVAVVVAETSLDSALSHARRLDGIR
jgi:hypothetical protein